MARFCPSTYPSARSPWRKAIPLGDSADDVPVRYPIRQTLPTGCAPTASGTARRARTTTVTAHRVTFIGTSIVALVLNMVLFIPTLGAAAELIIVRLPAA